ncbi:MAG: response regulator [Chloroflexi bacterium]|jgi:DNA-binding response OmpR family regulator|uniref:Response regulator n=1 Tax=Candidatus Chlorohelix allophototropha TaxID=3003348 RepID=A0A8T7M863_9CHLR|nr:response regulator [Chloroflexota bacterium]WJW68080.1 response regulator [Chloroflexota bacterium L227-S17]
MSKIMVVDDDLSVLEVIKNALTRKGFKVVTNDNPINALTLILYERPDLILLDYKMPELNGLEFLLKLRASNYPKTMLTPVLMMSAAPTPTLINALNSIELVDFIEKPFVSKELVAGVESALKRFKAR